MGHDDLRRGRWSLPHHLYHVIASTVGRAPAFGDFDAACAACRAFTAPSLLGDARLLAWVLMPDHAHWLLQLGSEVSLDDVVRRMKAASARAANRAGGRKGAVWGRAYFDRALRAEDDVIGVARYIVANPLRAGIVRRVGDYPFWDAAWIGPDPPVLQERRWRRDGFLDFPAKSRKQKLRGASAAPTGGAGL